MKHVFLLSMAFIVTLGAALGSFLFISLVPFFHPIGIAMTSVMMVGLACIAVLCIAFTYNRVGIWAAHRRREALLARVIVAGDIVAYPAVDGSIVHLSAEHERAKVSLPQMMLPSPQRKDDAEASQAIVLELYNSGVSLRNIVETTGLTYYQVQKITSAGKK